ncbi:MAG: N-acyl homoserine lactonase family protein [Gemmatimonadaceae bacterium]
MIRARSLVAALALIAACRPGGPGGGPASRAEMAPQAAVGGTVYEVYAVRYGTLPSFAVRSLVAGADSARRMDVALAVWLLRGGGRTVLVDAGFYRDKFIRRWTPTDYVRPSEAISALGLKPEDVTDVVVTHIHWDHLDGLDLFPKARVWIQRAEYEYYVGEGGAVRNAGIDPEDATMLAALHAAGRVMLVDGDAREILPGITAYTGGRHTFASQYVGARTRAGVVVLASDNAYLYENLERGVAIAQTFSAEENLAAQARMTTIATSPRLIVPGHDPAVFERFPAAAARAARID